MSNTTLSTPPVNSSKTSTKLEENVLDRHSSVVTFAVDDPENPYNWSSSKKFITTAAACFITYVSAFNATANGAAASGVIAEFGIKQAIFQTSSFTYVFCLGLIPLLLAPMSESFGRRPMLVFLTALVIPLWLPQALAKNIASISVTRFFQGAAASVEGPVIAGVISDCYKKQQRGTAMASFVLVVFTANATGPTCANWIAQNIGWRYIYWTQMGTNGLCFIITALFLRETRGEVILGKRAQRLNKEQGLTGDQQYITPEGYEKRNGAPQTWQQELMTSLMRPIVYLFTEPIVAALSLWVGFCWGIVFLFTGAVPHVFRETYGFSQGQAGTVLICGFIGAFFGWCLNFVNNRLYDRTARRNNGVPQPEARLYQAAMGGVLFGVGMFWFAWSARPEIHWIVPVIAIVVVNFAIYPIYLSVYAYMSDTYESRSSSAQASQSLLRNTLGATFPFFGVTMYNQLTFPWASSLIGFIAFALSVIPFVLLKYGKSIRLRSKVARQIAQKEERENEEALARSTRTDGLGVMEK